MHFNEPNFQHTSHARLRPDERCLDDGIISLGWNAGTIHIQYVGLQEIPESAIEAIKATMWKFNTECQLMSFLYAGVLGSQRAIQEQLGKNTDRGGSFTISGYYGDSTSRAIWARLPVGQVLDAFSEDGEFERLYAKAFVIFGYQMWEEFARPGIAQALGVSHDDVRSDLMGEWRHLRNWLIHPDKQTERAYFKNARMLAVVLGDLRPGHPEMKADKVFPLMGYLNSLRVIVNPKCLDPAMEITDLDPKIAEQISMERIDSGMKVVPIWRRFRPSENQQS